MECQKAFFQQTVFSIIVLKVKKVKQVDEQDLPSEENHHL
jgi:hypothetical protein